MPFRVVRHMFMRALQDGETPYTLLTQDGETPYNVAGKNLKVRKLLNQLMNASLEDSDEDEKGATVHIKKEAEDEEEWEEVEEKQS
jgi:hypothetical protein